MCAFQIRIFRSINQGLMWERCWLMGYNRILHLRGSCLFGFLLKLVVSSFYFQIKIWLHLTCTYLGLIDGYPLNPIPVGRHKLGFRSNCRFRITVPIKMWVPIFLSFQLAFKFKWRPYKYLGYIWWLTLEPYTRG